MYTLAIPDIFIIYVNVKTKPKVMNSKSDLRIIFLDWDKHFFKSDQPWNLPKFKTDQNTVHLTLQLLTSTKKVCWGDVFQTSQLSLKPQKLKLF